MDNKMNNVVPFENAEQMNREETETQQKEHSFSVNELLEELRSGFEALERVNEELEALNKEDERLVEQQNELFSYEKIKGIKSEEERDAWAQAILENRLERGAVIKKIDEILMDVQTEQNEILVIDVLNRWYSGRFCDTISVFVQ